MGQTHKRQSSSKRKTSVSKDAKPKKKSSLSKKRSLKPPGAKEYSGLKNTLEGLSNRMKCSSGALLKPGSITAIETEDQRFPDYKASGASSPSKNFLVDFRRNSNHPDPTPANGSGNCFSNSNHLKQKYSRDKNKNSANTLTAGTVGTADTQTNLLETTPSSIHHILNCQSLNKEINESIDSHKKKARRDLQSGPVRAGRPFELTKQNLFPALLDDAPAAHEQSSLNNSGRERAEAPEQANCKGARESSAAKISDSDAKKSPTAKQIKRSKKSVEKAVIGTQGIHFKTINEVLKLSSIKHAAPR